MLRDLKEKLGCTLKNVCCITKCDLSCSHRALLIDFDCLGSRSDQLECVSSTGTSHLQVFLVNLDLPRLPCDVSPLYFELCTIRCRTRYDLQP